MARKNSSTRGWSVYEREGSYYAKVKRADGSWGSYPTRQRDPQHANAVAAEMRARVLRGLPPVEAGERPTAPQLMTVAELLAKYREAGGADSKDRKVWLQSNHVYNQRILPILGHRVAASVTPDDVQQMMRTLREALSDASCNQTLNQGLSPAFNWAIDAAQLLQGRNPCSSVKRYKLKAKQAHLVLDQARQLLGLGDALPLLVELDLYHGLRRGELYGLRRDKLDLQHRTMKVDDSYDTGSTKTGAERTLPIHPAVFPRLERHLAALPPDCPWVFPAERRTRNGKQVVGWRMMRPNDRAPMAMMRPLLEQVGVVFTAAGEARKGEHPLHLVRHSFITHATRCGVNPVAVEVIAGHRYGGSQTTAKYLHLAGDLDFLRTELAKLTYAPQAPAQAQPQPAAAAALQVELRAELETARAEAARLRAELEQAKGRRRPARSQAPVVVPLWVPEETTRYAMMEID